MSFGKVEEVDEIQVVSDDDFLREVETRFIYRDMSLMDRVIVLVRENLVWFFSLYVGFSTFSFIVSYFDIMGRVSNVFLYICLFVSLILFFVVGSRVDWLNMTPKYYVMGVNEFFEVPRNGGEAVNVIEFHEIESISFADGSLEVEGSDSSIEFSLPSEGDITKIQNEVYNLDDSKD